MSTVAALSIDDYLATYADGHPPEFVDGALIDRPLTKYRHSKTQIRLAEIFGAVRRQHRLYPASEFHLRMPHNTVRIPDFAVFHPDEPADDVPAIPPFVVVEIVSPDERHGELMRKLEEYREWGIPNIWVVDPEARSLAVYEDRGLQRRERIEISAFGVEIKPADLFGA